MQVLPDNVLQKIAPYSLVRRMLLAQQGTLQSALSAYHLCPIWVKVIRQTQESGTEWSRVVRLMAKDVVACEALTHIETDRKDVVKLLEGRQTGIGQIMLALGIAPRFALEAVGETQFRFWRVYRLSGKGVEYQITEHFDKELYP